MNSIFSVIWVGMNHFETRPMVLSQKTKLQTTQNGKLVEELWWEKNQNGDWNSRNFETFFFEMSFDI